MITVTQICDGCGDSRELKIGDSYSGGWRNIIKDVATLDGWQQFRHRLFAPVEEDTHLCIKCVKKANES